MYFVAQWHKRNAWTSFWLLLATPGPLGFMKRPRCCSFDEAASCVCVVMGWGRFGMCIVVAEEAPEGAGSTARDLEPFQVHLSYCPGTSLGSAWM